MHARVVVERVLGLLSVASKQSRMLRWRAILVDLDQHCLHVGNRIVAASRAEVGLLHLLISRRNVPLSKEYILSQLFESGHGRDLRQVDMFVARLRQSLAAVGFTGLITTVAGRGYAVMDDHGDSVAMADARPQGWKAAALA